jgi:hypothetical protein
MTDKFNTVNVSVIGFLSLFMLLTLDAEDGRDVLDVLVPHIAAHTALIEAQTENTENTE